MSSFSLVSLIDGAQACSSSSNMGYYGLFFWFFLVIYLFIGLYVLCEHYFVPILLQVGKRLNMSDDVLGATLMAAGSSAPELFTALIGVLLYTNENPGPSTNCASAAFNMCIIIGCSIWCSGYQSLQIQGYPFVRECLFYAISIIELYLFYEAISPGKIEYFEALMLVSTWAFYILVLVYNETVIGFLARSSAAFGLQSISRELYNQRDALQHSHISATSGASDSETVTEQSQGQAGERIKFLAIYDDNDESASDLDDDYDYDNDYDYDCGYTKITDPGQHIFFHDAGAGAGAGNVATKSTSDTSSPIKIYDTFSSKCISKSTAEHRHDKNGIVPFDVIEESDCHCLGIIETSDETEVIRENHHISGTTVVTETRLAETDMSLFTTVVHFCKNQVKSRSSPDTQTEHETQEDEHVQEERLRDNILFLAVLPFTFLFAKTIISTQQNSSVCRMVFAFVLCIIWLGFLTFLCVDATEKIGNCFGLNADVMGLTLLAIGSSLPDCFSSILAAKQGKGGMAVSNALGSNVFDICICVGFSFLIKSTISGFSQISVARNQGFALFIIALLVLLAMFMVMMFCAGLRLTKFQGASLFLMYIVFLATFCYLLEVD